jgi:predicted nucleic acid-binding Zn ribbon protein
MCDDTVMIGSTHAPIQRPLSARECLVCGNPLPANGRGRYCSRACQQRAYRLRQQPGQPALLAAWTAHLKEQQALLQRTIYACSSCEQRYLGQHRCPDCNLMCHKLGLGDSCPQCDEPVLLSELLGGELP